jgi:hypothetical protein
MIRTIPCVALTQELSCLWLFAVPEEHTSIITGAEPKGAEQLVSIRGGYINILYE